MKEKRSKKAARTYRVTDAVEIYRAIRPEFDYDGGIFCKDDTRTARLKWVCTHRLDTAERVLVYLYAELGSIRDLAAMLGVARSTLADEMKRIKGKVAAEIAALETEDNDKRTDKTDA